MQQPNVILHEVQIMEDIGPLLFEFPAPRLLSFPLQQRLYAADQAS